MAPLTLAHLLLNVKANGRIAQGASKSHQRGGAGGEQEATTQSNTVMKPQVRDGVTDGEGAVALMRVGGCVFVYDVCVCVRLPG